MWRQAALLLSIVLGIYGACPSGYSLYDGTCYKLYSTAKSRQDASFQCQLDGATLPVITTASQDQYILNFARQVGSVWLGLQCASDSNCRFDDYTPFTTGSYNNFVGGRADTRFGKCTIMDENPPYSGAWGSADCNTLNSSFVCQVSYNGIQRTPGYCNQGEELTVPLNIYTPHYPSAYPIASSCLWQFYSGSSSYKVNVTFTEFALQPDASVLFFNTYPLVSPSATFAGSKTAPFSVVSSSYRMWMIFSSTNSYTPSRGFNATVARTTL